MTTMEGPKYLIIITLIEGQNFNVPEGAPEKIDACVYAEARFGNESILTSDPIKLSNSNPEFVTELAWQLDKRSLHQLRVERKAIKLQVFLQTREKSKSNRQQDEQWTAVGTQSIETSATNKVELIGYTIIDIRSAQETDQPKFQWLPLLNPKFRKSSYNRPEIQLAVTLSRIDDTTNGSESLPSTSSLQKPELKKKLAHTSDSHSESSNGTHEISSLDNLLYKTCLDYTLDNEEVQKDEILENDITIRSRDGNFYIYDGCNSIKSTIDDCDEAYKITITIPFTSELETLVREQKDSFYFSVSLFGSSIRTNNFKELTSVETKEVEFVVFTTHPGILTTYFALNSYLVIKLHQSSGEPVGLASIKLDQLCNLETKRRSIEGIFALQSMSDHDIPSAIHPSIGVSVVLEKTDHQTSNQDPVLISDKHIELARKHFGEDIDDYLSRAFDDTHQLTVEPTVDTLEDDDYLDKSPKSEPITRQEDHHFCFIIDLKSFSYTSDQRLIPTLRELLVRYSYPFFGYEDSFTTDASIPISSTKSIIVNGFFELNFATTANSLLTAFQEIPLDLDILRCDERKRGGSDLGQTNDLVATSCLNLAQTLSLDRTNILNLQNTPVNVTVSIPIVDLEGCEIGEIQIYLCLKDLGRPKVNDIKTSIEHLDNCNNRKEDKTIIGTTSLDHEKLNKFMTDAKSDLQTWKEECLVQLSDQLRARENERLRRIYQRFESKETKRELEFRKRMDDLNSLERKLKNSLAHIESLERRLSNNFEQLKTKDALLDTRLDTFDLKISQAINNIKIDYEKRLDAIPSKIHRSFGENAVEQKILNNKIPSKVSCDTNQARRSSLKNPIVAGIPVPVRSSSLVRGPSEGASTRIVKRATGVATTVINGITSRPRSSSTRLNLSKETQEKLTSLRKEKAELLKRGCRPNDELIQEINSLIEKLAC